MKQRNYFYTILTIIQCVLGMRVIWRLLRSAGGTSIRAEDAQSIVGDERVTVLVPVLNEYERLAPCLEGLMRQGQEVAEILVIDGGSTDGTQELVTRYMQRDARMRLVDAAPIPDDWNGKAWGMQVGLQAMRVDAAWILTIDADVRPKEQLTRALLGKACVDRLAALSIATKQEVGSVGEGLLHPALLTTLVYRFGMPNRIFRQLHDVQASGQCFLVQRAVLDVFDGFAAVRHSVCEDVTLARLIVRTGHRVGFYEAENLVSVRMYANWRETWQNWTRSLPLRDQFSGLSTLIGLLEVVFIQASPPLLIAMILLTQRRQYRLMMVNCVLATLRIGVLFGTARAYSPRPWSYWLSPLCDFPVAIQLMRMAVRRTYTWRGRVIHRG